MTTGERQHCAEKAPAAAPGHPMPIRIGDAETFAALRDVLRAAEFNGPAVAAALKISDISQIPSVNSATLDRDSISPTLLTFIEFFALGNAVAAHRLRESCGEEALATLHALGLIRDARAPEGSVYCSVWIYPVDGFLIASDRRTLPAGDVFLNAPEVVFPAHDSGTLHLLRLLPPGGSGDALDLCGGSGIGALYLARNGYRAATADITQRSSYFAEFNAKLNEVEIEILRGDLFAPVSDRSFDVISAHPPWVPSTGNPMVFRDGGDAGDAIVERVFAGIPDHLRLGGTGIVVSLGHDGRDGAYEQRVRGWLGDGGRDCDVILGINKLISIDEMVESMRRLHLDGDAEKAKRIAARLRDRGIETFVYGAVLVRRIDTEIAEPPLRLRMSSAATAADFERVFAWRRHRRRPDFAAWLEAVRPRLCPGLEVRVNHVVRDGALVADSAVLTAKRPLTATVKPDVWIARLLERLEGTQTVGQAFAAARQAGQMPDGCTLAAFVDLVGRMVERGLLDIDLPAA